jgi:flagellar hook-basal body complex protein FliE
MVNGIGSGGSSSLAKQAIEAALQRQKDTLSSLQQKAAGLPAEQSQAATFSQSLQAGIQEVDQAVKAADTLPLRVVEGNIDIHEAAARIKQSQLAFDFALEVRNKFIDAYREVMRMNV